MQSLQYPRILAVVTALDEDLLPDTIPSIRNQTLPVSHLIHLNKPAKESTTQKRLAKILNEGLKHVNLKDYDYILRVDGDTILPHDFLELNLKGKPDVVGAGYAHLIKVKPFLKYMNGKFYEGYDDCYVNILFSRKGLKVLPYAVHPTYTRSSKYHGYKYYLTKGEIQYCAGWGPFHIIEDAIVHRSIFLLIGYYLSILKRVKKFPIAKQTFTYQIRRLFTKHGIRNFLERRDMRKPPPWVYGPSVLQLDTRQTCNLNCVYCNKNHFLEGRHGVMSLETAEKAMKQLKDHVREVRPFQNGDPMFEHRLPQFTALAKKILKAKTTIYTNGTLYQKRHMLLDPNLDEVHFTISAATHETYVKVHGKPFFRLALKTLDWFAKHKRDNQKIYVHFVIVKENIDELELWKTLFKDYPQVISQLHNGYKQYSSQNCINKLDKSARKKSTLKGAITHNEPCACYHPITIGFDGTIIQCPVSPYSVNYGNIKDTHLLKAWNKRNLNMMNNPACQKCNQKNRLWKAIFQRYIKPHKPTILMLHDCAFVGYELNKELTRRKVNIKQVLYHTGKLGFHLKKLPLIIKLFAITILKSYDLIHCHYLGLASAAAAYFGHKPYILHLHGTDIREKTFPFWRHILNKATHIVYSTPDLKKHIPSEYHSKCSYLPTPVGKQFHKLHEESRPITEASRILPYQPPRTINNHVNGVAYELMPSILNNVETFYDQNTFEALSKTALEALACGCKVVDYADNVLTRFPEQHKIEKVTSKLIKIYNKMLN